MIKTKFLQASIGISMVFLTVIDNKAYVLILTCEQNKFANYKETGEKILNSFTFTK
jgi:hypothetical protein